MTLGTDGTFQYTPTANWNGTDAFTYEADDGGGVKATATVSLTVAAVNDPPVAEAKSASADAGSSVGITLTGSDAEGDTLGFIIVTLPSNGTLAGSGASRQYTPVSGFSGTDTFSYKVNDTQDDSAPATVSITVNAATSPQQVTQGISLVQGWNLVSLHTQPADMSPSSVFTGHFDVIKEMRTLSGTFNTSWPLFLNSIKQLDLADSYWVKANAARSGIQITGAPPTSTVINLTKGWNLIGFPSVGAQETATLFKPLSDRNAIKTVIGNGEFTCLIPT